MEENISSLLLKLEEILRDFSRDFVGLESVHLLDGEGFTVVAFKSSDRNEKILYRLINLLKEDFPTLNLLEIENPHTRLCLAKIPDTNYFIAVYASSRIAAGLVRVKIRNLSRKIRDHLISLEKSVEQEEEVDVQDLMKLLEFLSKR